MPPDPALLSPGRVPEKTMDPIYARIRDHARKIASRLPPPRFHTDCADAIRQSVAFFESDPTIGRLHRFVAKHLENDFGHGLDHAIKVTLDAGALLVVEGLRQGCPDDRTHSRLRVIQSAGLLHDIERKQKNHAKRGAETARKILAGYPFTIQEIADIHCAIANHEAFTEPAPVDTPEARLVSDCLYDADKFRWGPDNFTHTVWDMVCFSVSPLSKFVAYYPKGIQGLTRIRATFRTPTGCFYGPEFIDQGLAIGDELLQFIRAEFAGKYF